jgi:deoxycytidylate deaminase
VTPYDAMQHAVDVVNTSEHIKNKVAACVFNATLSSSDSIGGSGALSGYPLIKPKDDISVSTNYRPTRLKNNFTPDQRIGNSSQFIHAEVGTIFSADFPTLGASIAVTDPMCPNCAKAICAAGIRHVYIDNKGMEKDFFIRRKDAFTQLSLPMMKQSGIGVSVINRKEKSETIMVAGNAEGRNTGLTQTLPPSFNTQSIADILKHMVDNDADRSFAIAKTDAGVIYCPERAFEIQTDNQKYRPVIDPINHLLLHIKRQGLDVLNTEIGCNLAPSSRAIVNMIGFGIRDITINSDVIDHDEQGLNALATIKKFDLMQVDPLY